MNASMLVLTEDQELLAESAREVVAGSAPLTRFRSNRDAGVTHDATLWAELVDLGWAGIPFAEDVGGLGMGLAELAVVVEQLGRNLAATPLASAAAAAVLAPDFGTAEGKVLALAWRELARGADPGVVATGFADGRLSGRKRDVLDVAAADAFAVSAREADGIGVFLVPKDAVEVIPRTRLDHRDVGDVILDGVEATRLDGGLDGLQEAVDAMGIILAAEALGALDAAVEMTSAYLRERHQFDAPIGSFQALQHRMVDVFVQAELARSAVMKAAREPTPSFVALAQAKTAQAFLHATKEAIQMHGGIGMTDEHDIGFYAKRALVYAREVDGAAGRFVA